MRYSGQQRLLHFVNGPPQAMLQHMEGHEQLHAPYRFSLDFLLPTHLDKTAWLGQSVTWSVQHPGQMRFFNGIVTSIEQSGSDNFRSHSRYRFIVEPSIAKMRHQTNCRIFQQLSVPDIVKQLLDENGLRPYSFMLIRQYPAQTYCVQYNESNLAFIQRILAQAGITFYFTQQNGEHQIVFTDDISGMQPFSNPVLLNPNANTSDERPHLSHWQQSDRLHSQQWTQRQFNINTPLQPIDSNTQASLQAQLPRLQGLEHFHYPSHATTSNESDLLSKLHQARIECQSHFIETKGNYAQLIAGNVFQLTSNTPQVAAGKYLVTRIEHVADDISHNTKNMEHKARHAHYKNTLTVLSNQYVYQPPLRERPQITSLQTAFVTGDSNGVTTDALGNVHVRFHWDRSDNVGSSTSCWIRVAQAWSSNGFGLHFTPRVGQEVLVKFMHNDPDEPIIVGMVPNLNNTPATDLPAKRGQTVISSQSLGDPSKHHHILFDDNPADARIEVHSANELYQAVNNDWQESIGHNYTLCAGNEVTNISGDFFVDAQSISLQVGGSSLVMNSSGITLQSAAIDMKGQGTGGSYPVSVLGNKHHCPKSYDDGSSHNDGKIVKGSSDVFIDGKPVARVSDQVACRHGDKHPIKKGAPNILVDNIPVAHVKSKTGHGGKITQGSALVKAGDNSGVGTETPISKQLQKHSSGGLWNDILGGAMILASIPLEECGVGEAMDVEAGELMEGGEIAEDTNAAHNAKKALDLKKSLASEQQLSEEGIVTAGKGSDTTYREAHLAADQYGGEEADWTKKTSSSYTSSDGTQFETHWIENLNTGERFEQKTKYILKPR